MPPLQLAKQSLISYGTSFFAILCIHFIHNLLLTIIFVPLYFFCIIIIWHLSPVVHKNKPLSSQKIQRLHFKCGRYVILLSILNVLFLLTKYQKNFITVSVSVIIICISSVVGQIQNRKDSNLCN